MSLWKEKTERKKVSEKILENRVTTWLTHFRSLLGTHQTMEGPVKGMPAVLEDLSIIDGPFTAGEFPKVKACAGLDGTPPKVIKNCNHHFEDLQPGCVK